MNILHSNEYGSLDESALGAFEGEIGSRLPDEYRTFLLRHNGGVPDPACFLAPDDPFEEGSERSERELFCLFALHDGAWNDDTPEGSRGFPLQEAWRDLVAERGERDLLPVGRDLSGNYVCVGLLDGSVSFYDHDYEVAVPLGEGFEAFLAALRPCS